MAGLQVVLIDDDIQRSEKLKEVWKSILEPVFKSIDLRYVSDVDKIDEIFLSRPHILIVDNVFANKENDEVENVGLDFIQENKPKYKDCLFVLCTGETFRVVALGTRFPNPDLIVTKNTLINEKYKEYIGQVLFDKVKRLPCGNITVPNPKDGQDFEQIRTFATSIVEQVTSGFQKTQFSNPITQINLKKLGGGFSGARVYKAEIFGPEMFNSVPFVFKMGHNSDIQNEVDRYNAYVRLRMPHDMRVDLVGFGSAGDFSGALYAFAFGGSSEILSATDHVVSGNFDPIKLVIEKLFGSSEIGWYKDVQAHLRVDDFYNNSEEYAPNKDKRRINQINQYLRDYFKELNIEVNEENYRVSGKKLPHIRRKLGSYDSTPLQQVVCHGDLNTNNIFINNSFTSLSTIDFEYAGYDQIFKDFVSLEVSLRVYSPGNSEEIGKEYLLTAMQSESDLLNGSKSQEGEPNFFNSVRLIREAAKKLCDCLDVPFNKKVYSVALAFHLLKVAGLPGWNKQVAGNLIGALLASTSDA